MNASQACFIRTVLLPYDPEIFRRARMRHGWTQEEAAQRSGLNKITISHIETGYKVHEESIRLYSEALGLEMAQVSRNGQARPDKSLSLNKGRIRKKGSPMK